MEHKVARASCSCAPDRDDPAASFRRAGASFPLRATRRSRLNKQFSRSGKNESASFTTQKHSALHVRRDDTCIREGCQNVFLRKNILQIPTRFPFQKSEVPTGGPLNQGGNTPHSMRVAWERRSADRRKEGNGLCGRQV